MIVKKNLLALLPLLILSATSVISLAGCSRSNSGTLASITPVAHVESEFLQMVRLVPVSFISTHDLWFSNLAKTKALSGFQGVKSYDALMKLSADQRKSLADALAGVPEIQRINNWVQIAPVIGFDAWMIDRTIFDDVVPPKEFSILEGSFDQASIREKLTAQGYQKISYGYYDYLSLNEDYSPGNLQSPISQQVLAQLNRVGFLGNTLITAPDTSTVTSVLDVRMGTQLNAEHNPGALVLSAGMGDVLSSVLISPSRLIYPAGDSSRPPFNFSPPPDWDRLHQYDMVGMGFKEDGTDRVWTITLYYSDAGAAGFDAPILAKRLSSYIFNTEFEQGPGQNFKPTPLMDQFEVGQPTAQIYHGPTPASTLSVDLQFKSTTPSSAWLRYAHDFRDLLFLVPDPSPYLVKPAAAQSLTLEQASAQLKERGYVVVDTAAKASQLVGYAVATPAFVPAGFVPVMEDVTGSFVLSKLGFGVPNAPDVPIMVDQKYAQNPDPRAPHGPFFTLEQTTQLHGLAGTAIDIEIAGYPGKKVLKPPDGRPPGIHMAWTDGARYYDLEGELTGPLDEATLLQVAASMGVH
jgi:hypothetical protein